MVNLTRPRSRLACGAAFVDCGASMHGAGFLEAEATRLIGMRAGQVFRSGAQGHRWPGKDCFRSKGAGVIARAPITESRQGSAR